jgi:hypothetical protein
VLVPALIASRFRNRSAVRMTGASGAGSSGTPADCCLYGGGLSLLAGNDGDMTVFSRGMTEGLARRLPWLLVAATIQPGWPVPASSAFALKQPEHSLLALLSGARTSPTAWTARMTAR